MGALLNAVIGFFAGDAGKAVGGTVANVSALVALAPVAVWFLKDKDVVAIQLTWGHIAFIGLIMFAVIKIVHYTRSPGQ